MSSPKSWNWFFSRSFSSGRLMSFWLCRKFICRRTSELPSRCTASHASYIRKWSRFGSPCVGLSGVVAGGRTWSRCAVRPDARRVAHRVDRAPLPVLERLAHAQVVERAVRLVRVAGRDRALGADDHRAGQRVGDALEERLAEAVRHRGPAAAGVDEDRPVGDAQRRARRASAGGARRRSSCSSRPSR